MPMERESAGGIRAILLRGGAGGVLLKVSQVLLTFGLTTFLARTCGPEAYGVYVFAFAIIQLLSIPAEMGTSVLMVREVSAYGARGQWGALKGVLQQGSRAVGLASIGLGLLVLLAVWGASNWLEPADNRVFGTLVVGIILLPLLTLTNFHGAALRGFGQIVNGQLAGLVIRPGTFLLVAVVISQVSGPEALQPRLVMGLQAAAAGAALLTAWILLRRRVPDAVKTANPLYETRRWARSSLSLTFIAGMMVINSQTDIIMLGLFKTPDMVGVYRVAVQCALVVALGLDIVNMVVAPVMARLYTAGDMTRLQSLTRLSARLALAGAVPVAGLYYFLGENILGRVFGPEFVPGLTALFILSLGKMINAAAGALVVLLNMTGKESSVVRGFMLSGGLNVVLNYLLIPRWGMEGAATATAISLLAWTLYLGRCAARQLGISPWAFGRSPATPGTAS